MPTPLDSMNLCLDTMEKELTKGVGADLEVIATASQMFHLNVARNNWASTRLEIKNQFMRRWFDLNDQAKSLPSPPPQQTARQEEQLSLAI